MYNLWIPIQNRKLDEKAKTELIMQLKRVMPQKVLLVFNRVLFDKDDLKNELELFEENKRILENASFSVGAWLAPTIGYGSPLNERDHNPPYTHMVKFNSDAIGDAYCPLDVKFTDDFCNLVKTIAKSGVNEIMFEDDFTFSGGKTWGGIYACACEKHLDKFSCLVGEKIKLEDLNNLLYNEGPNKYRKTWFSMQGDILSSFCKKIRDAVNEINPNIRIGLSANASSYIQEGITIDKLAKIIAGDTKPFIRLTGAPYWPFMPTNSSAIDTIRVQSIWCDKEIELLTEGDTYPRPRHFVPANKLEAYDMILRADNHTHGILKYMLDYSSRADYETGYIDRHILNKPVYEYIDTHIGGKTIGLEIFEKPDLLENITFGDDFPTSMYGEGHYFPLVSQIFTAENSIPTTYENNGDAVICFGENARYIPKERLKNGVILDAAAAKILYERGIDVGFTSFEKANTPNTEYFIPYDDQTPCTTNGSPVFYRFNLKEKAEVKSIFICTGYTLGGVSNILDLENAEKFPASYMYENKDGNRFFVYSFVAKTAPNIQKGFPRSGLFRNYYRQKQLSDAIKYLQKGRQLPAMCYKNPELYILCKKDNNKMHVCIFNLFADSVLNPKIELDNEYKNISFFNNSGKIKGNCAYLDNEIMPYGYVFFTVE